MTDCNTLYPGCRKNAVDHLDIAARHGFLQITTGCPVIIGDGLKGTDEVDVPVRNGEYCKTAHIGRAIMDADVFISLSHFKGHEATGFGGTCKNIGMGCGSRAGKMDQHNSGKPVVNQDACRGCKMCAKECGSDAISFDSKKHSSTRICAKAAEDVSVHATLTRYTIPIPVQMKTLTARWPNTQWLFVTAAPVFI